MNLDVALVKVIKVIYFIVFLYGVILLFAGGLSMKKGDVHEVMESVFGALMLVAGPIIIETLFNLYGFGGILRL